MQSRRRALQALPCLCIGDNLDGWHTEDELTDEHIAQMRIEQAEQVCILFWRLNNFFVVPYADTP